MKKNKPIIFLAGFAVLLLGIILVLAWWPAVVGLFKGFAGMGLAVLGLLLMYFAGKS
jgi:hypothetical protein